MLKKGEGPVKDKQLFITNIPAISAIYFSLLQCGYDFYSIERDELTIEKLRGFIAPDHAEYGFFSEIKQHTCEVYPYWPRASMLETASFYVDLSQKQFVDFDTYKDNILSAKNISDIERNQLFWDWIIRFPEALKNVINSDSFCCYMKWERTWLEKQNQKNGKKLENIQKILALCKEKYQSPIYNIRIVLNPIKCVYSADYHRKDADFTFCSGKLSEESLIHEFLHHIVHPVIENREDEILCYEFDSLKIDASYYLNHGELGRLNAFEEYMVRELTDTVIRGNIPENLSVFFDQLIRTNHPSHKP